MGSDLNFKANFKQISKDSHPNKFQRTVILRRMPDFPLRSTRVG